MSCRYFDYIKWSTLFHSYICGDIQLLLAIPAGDTSLINKIIHQQLVTSKADIEIQHKDPKSPLYSVKTFEALRLWVQLLTYISLGRWPNIWVLEFITRMVIYIISWTCASDWSLFISLGFFLCECTFVCLFLWAGATHNVTAAFSRRSVEALAGQGPKTLFFFKMKTSQLYWRTCTILID